ncbi:hypothetical protein [Parabacteroides sp. FAFU027]|uniref:hypothetical protein n=1 Tax=Parabacteroides sp. FAFU027 TaxID=2922715 RepID=UPI001FAEDCB1|nr:hypothetical protein [Parabacteroides sp. FAFU027]
MKRFEDIDELIEKYFEGETSVAEEKALHRFFRQKHLPKKYRAEKAMFDHFASEKVGKAPRRARIIPQVVRWTAIAAAIIGSVWIINRREEPAHPLIGSYVIIDGTTYTNPQKVREHALKALDDVTMEPKSHPDEEAERLMKEQLSLFE